MAGKTRHTGQEEDYDPNVLAQELAELLAQAHAEYRSDSSGKGDLVL